MSLGLSGEILVQEVAIFVGVESLLVDIVVVLVGSADGRGEEQCAQIASPFQNEAAVAGRDLQLAQILQLDFQPSYFLVFGQLSEGLLEADQLQEENFLEEFAIDGESGFAGGYISFYWGTEDVRSRFEFWRMANCRVLVIDLIINKLIKMLRKFSKT